MNHYPDLSKNRARLFLAAACLFASIAVQATPSNKWRIEVDGRASVAGEIELSITPNGGVPSNVVVAIPVGTSENAAAKLIRNSLRTTYGKSIYKTGIDDGEDVLIKAQGSTPDFDLVVVRNTAEGLKLELDRE